MKLHILSDSHLEFSSFEPPPTDADVIVLAGDIGKGAKGVYWAREVFPEKPILYVPGNHEFYGTQRSETLSLLHIAGKQNRVHLLDDGELVMKQEGVRFLGCTLWTDFCLYGEMKQKIAMKEGQRRLSDFRVIQEGSCGHFSPAHSIDLHQKSLAWLKAKLDEPFDGKTVVITHHLPSMQSVVDRFKNDLLSACFASEVSYLFGKMDIWIHGHTHDNLDYEANGTRVICNPRGYVTSQRTENYEFIPGLVVEV
jgi:predicted phosphodiesterase